MLSSDWSSDVCSSDLRRSCGRQRAHSGHGGCLGGAAVLRPDDERWSLAGNQLECPLRHAVAARDDRRGGSMSGTSGALGVALWEDGQPFPGTENGIRTEVSRGEKEGGRAG